MQDPDVYPQQVPQLAWPRRLTRGSAHAVTTSVLACVFDYKDHVLRDLPIMKAENGSTGSSPANRMSSSSRDGQHALSCTNCRHRKVRCDKIHPCCHCQRSNLTCVFPERAKNTQRKRAGQKPSNDELLRRLKRMEELIGKIEGEGADEQAPKPTIASGPEKRRRSHIEESLRSGTSSVQGNDRDIPEDRLDRYIGNNFLRSLTMEVSNSLLRRQKVHK